MCHTVENNWCFHKEYALIKAVTHNFHTTGNTILEAGTAAEGDDFILALMSKA